MAPSRILLLQVLFFWVSAASTSSSTRAVKLEETRGVSSLAAAPDAAVPIETELVEEQEPSPAPQSSENYHKKSIKLSYEDLAGILVGIFFFAALAILGFYVFRTRRFIERRRSDSLARTVSIEIGEFIADLERRNSDPVPTPERSLVSARSMPS